MERDKCALKVLNAFDLKRKGDKAPRLGGHTVHGIWDTVQAKARPGLPHTAPCWLSGRCMGASVFTKR